VVAKEDQMLAREYAREALKNGLKLEKRLGTNPYKMGFLGATDSHTALAAVQEDNFFGKHSGYEPDPNRMNHMFMKSTRSTGVIPVKPSLTPWSEKKCMLPQEAVFGFGFLVDGIIR
jgi:hypothetical protein